MKGDHQDPSVSRGTEVDRIGRIDCQHDHAVGGDRLRVHGLDVEQEEGQLLVNREVLAQGGRFGREGVGDGHPLADSQAVLHGGCLIDGGGVRDRVRDPQLAANPNAGKDSTHPHGFAPGEAGATTGLVNRDADEAVGQDDAACVLLDLEAARRPGC